MPIIEIPVELGTTVYKVIPKCDPPPFLCPYSGGRGAPRCSTGLCGAYIKETTFSLDMYYEWNKTVFSTKEKAQKFLDNHKNY